MSLPDTPRLVEKVADMKWQNPRWTLNLEIQHNDTRDADQYATYCIVHQMLPIRMLRLYVSFWWQPPFSPVCIWSPSPGPPALLCILGFFRTSAKFGTVMYCNAPLLLSGKLSEVSSHDKPSPFSCSKSIWSWRQNLTFLAGLLAACSCIGNNSKSLVLLVMRLFLGCSPRF